MYLDHSPEYDDYWTVALIDSDHPGRETHFGVFDFPEVREAMESGEIRLFPGQHLELRRIRRFPN